MADLELSLLQATRIIKGAIGDIIRRGNTEKKKLMLTSKRLGFLMIGIPLIFSIQENTIAIKEF